MYLSCHRMTYKYTKRLSRAHMGPFRSILAVADDIFGAAYNEDRPANCQWLDNHFLSLRVDDTVFHLPTLSDSIIKLENDLIHRFHTVLCLGISPTTFTVCPQGRVISENIKNLQVGHNFINNPTNSWFKGHQDVLVQAILQDQNLCNKFVQSYSNGNIHWNKAEITNWLQLCSSWEEDCLALTHLTYGGVARKPEILGLKLRNTASSFRGVLVWDGLVTLLSHYHKGQALSGKRKVSVQFDIG